MNKPTIIILSSDDAEQLDWMSGGWYSMKERAKNPVKAGELFTTACDCITAAADVKDAVVRLKKAGFQVERPQDEARHRVRPKGVI